MAYFEVYLHDGRVEHFELKKSNMTVGRSPETDIHIDDPVVSRLHARIDKTGKGRWTITDLDSRNKTYYNGQAVKSLLLTNKDIFYLGSIKVIFQDPSGISDEKTQQTVYLDQTVAHPPAARPKTQLNRETVCPKCKVKMESNAIVCLNCGYNIKTKKLLEVMVEETAESSAIGEEPPKPSGSKKTERVLTTPPAKPVISPKNWTMLQDIILPVAFFLISILILAISMPIEMFLTGLVGILFRSILLFISMAVASKIGSFGFDNFGTMVLKVIAIAAALTVLASIGGAFSIVFSLALLVGLLKLFFQLDAFEWFLIVAIMGILNNFVANVMLAAVATMLRENH